MCVFCNFINTIFSVDNFWSIFQTILWIIAIFYAIDIAKKQIRINAIQIQLWQLWLRTTRAEANRNNDLDVVKDIVYSWKEQTEEEINAINELLKSSKDLTDSISERDRKTREIIKELNKIIEKEL